MKKRLTTTILVSALSAIGFAQTFTTADGNGADATVRRGDSDANYGGVTNILVRDAASASDRKAYVRFDLTGLLASPTDAFLEFIWVGGGNGSSGTTHTMDFYGLNDGHAGENWIEGTGNETTATGGSITWDTAPANSTNSSNNFIGTDSTFLGGYSLDFSTPSVGDVITITNSDLGGNLLSFINADTDGNLTIMMSINDGNSGADFLFASKENATYAAPTLTVIPEPSSLALMLGFTVAGFMFLRRRR